MRLCSILLWLLFASSLVACTSIPPRTARNQPICPPGTNPVDSISANAIIQRGCSTTEQPEIVVAPRPSQHVPRARQQFAETDADVPDVFVGLAISGGGSRAAVFGMAVMKELDEIGILQHVSAISTTSGGGLAGAYYALNAQDIDWSRAQETMAIDYLGPWLRRNAGPGQIFRVATTDEDRSDLMSDIFDERIFNGKTYSDLGDFSPGKAPIWLANTTAIGDTRRFTFSEREFDQLNSSLGSFPISQAAMASAAFPGVFNSVTLRDYTPAYAFENRLQYASDVRFKHLIDGGPTDNLGIEALLELARSHSIAKSGPLGDRRPQARQGKCLLLIVDAHPRGVPSRYDAKRDLRGALGRLVDGNFFDALDALLAVRRSDLLGYLGLQDSGPFGRRKAPQFVFFDAPTFSSRIGQARRIGTDDIDALEYDNLEPAEIANRVPVREQTFRCAAWHLNLGGIEAIKNYSLAEGEQEPRLAARNPELEEQRALHQLLTAQVATNFKLTGPAGCSAPLIERSLRESAAVLVNEDYRSQASACNWLRANGLEVNESCGAWHSPSSIERMPLRNIVVPTGAGTPGGPPDEAVRCATDPTTVP